LADVAETIRFAGRDWHTVLEDAPSAVLIVDETGSIKWANRAFVTLFGYSRPEVVGKQINFLLPEDRRENHARYISGWFQHPRPRPMGSDLNIQGKNKNGDLLDLDIQLSPIETAEGILAEAWIRERPSTGA
jgi:PAS domain S-box-containing protein